MPVDGYYATDMLPTMILLGIGAGLVFPAVVTLAMSSATPEDAGLASGLTNTTLQVGGALGLAVLATLSTTRTENLVAEGRQRRRRPWSTGTSSRTSSRSACSARRSRWRSAS